MIEAIVKLLYFLINLFLLIPSFIISLLPSVDAVIPDNVFESMSVILANVGYVLPIKGLLPIFIISMSVNIFKLAMAIIVRIKSFIPTMGD